MGKARIIELGSKEELDRMFSDSMTKTCFLFKHSSMCGISGRVLKNLADFESDLYLITVQSARDLSNSVVEMTGIRHESPQVLIIRDGKCVFDASHFDIKSETLELHLSND